jgi:hypothetical protein
MFILATPRSRSRASSKEFRPVFSTGLDLLYEVLCFETQMPGFALQMMGTMADSTWWKNGSKIHKMSV